MAKLERERAKEGADKLLEIAKYYVSCAASVSQNAPDLYAELFDYFLRAVRVVVPAGKTLNTYFLHEGTDEVNSTVDLCLVTAENVVGLPEGDMRLNFVHSEQLAIFHEDPCVIFIRGDVHYGEIAAGLLLLHEIDHFRQYRLGLMGDRQADDYFLREESRVLAPEVEAFESFLDKTSLSLADELADHVKVDGQGIGNIPADFEDDKRFTPLFKKGASPVEVSLLSTLMILLAIRRRALQLGRDPRELFEQHMNAGEDKPAGV